MAEPSLQLGNGNWAGKSSNLLAYHKVVDNFYADELTFSRASSGTIVNADGLIEQVPYNKLQQSNQFDTTWINQLSGTIVGGQSGYDGTDNAWKLSKSAATFKSVRQVITTSGIQTLSAYLKADTLDKASFRIDTTSVIFVDFDLTNGTYYISGGFPTSANIQEVSNGWYRADVTFNESITNVHIYVDKSNATSGSIFVQDAQLNSGSTAKTYYPTTTRLNVPRVDYLNNSNGSLLLEPQRTNSIPHNNDLNNFSTRSNVSIVSNTATSPDGTTNAHKLNTDTATSSHYINQAATNSGVENTISCFAKKGEYNYIQLASLSSVQQYANFDLNLGVVGTKGTRISSSKIEDYGNGWYRCVCVLNNVSSLNGASFVISNSASAAWLPSFTGVVNEGIYLFGCQLELTSSYPTSYIPTSGTTVTRLQDTSSTAGLSSVIGQTEGTMYIDFTYKGLEDVNNMTSLSDGGVSNRVQLNISSSGIGALIVSNGVTSFTSSNTSLVVGNRYKVAVKYKVNDFALWINGTETSTDTLGDVPLNLNRFSFAFTNGTAFHFNQTVSASLLYKTALTNTELATLTT